MAGPLYLSSVNGNFWKFAILYLIAHNLCHLYSSSMVSVEITHTHRSAAVESMRIGSEISFLLMYSKDVV